MNNGFGDTPVCAAPPHSEAVEESILGSCIVSPDALEMACRTLRPEHFYSTLHQIIFQTVLDMRFHGENIDPISLAERLHGGDEEKDSKIDYMLSCLVEGVETYTNISTFTKILLEKHRLRSLRDASIRLQAAIENDDSAAVGRAQAEIAEIKTDDTEGLPSPVWGTHYHEHGIPERKPELIADILRRSHKMLIGAPLKSL